MGFPMSYRLLNAGVDLTVHNRSQAKVQQIAGDGAHPARSTAEITQATDIVLACLPDIATVEEVFLGPDGIIKNARPGQVLVDHSTVGVKTSNAGAERAADGTLTIMAGGPREAYGRAFPFFEAMGTTVRHIGPTGTGSTVKLVNQLLVGVHMLAAAEAMLLGAKSGADPELVFEVVNSGWGQSFMLGRNAPVMLDRDFEGIRTQMQVFLKDLGLIQELSQELDSPIPAGDLVYKLFQQAVSNGLGEKDGAAIVLPLEEQAGFQIRRLAKQP
jgi:3-hydroxyisobutyrate dehydrogenase-like beta-hydroxyacid dehydrogenase